MIDIVRVGVVSDVDTGARKVRVMHRDTGITSGWLAVLQHIGADVVVAKDCGHTHNISDTYTGGGGASTEPDHDHPGTKLSVWLPKVGDRVLVIYLPVDGGDGFVLGGL